MTRVASFAEIETEFVARAHAMVWCNCATTDASGRPRSRVVHPYWEGEQGWITTLRSSLKVKQVAANPFVSLGYVADPFRPIYVECRAVWDGDLATRRRLWDLLKSIPSPLGFDAAAVWGNIDDPENGLLRLTPWRIEMNDFSHESGPPVSKVWRA
jgi:uncharacterized pyridoxamine 5'-phosphate oxidase family protein